MRVKPQESTCAWRISNHIEKTRRGLFHTLATHGILIRHGHGMIYDKVRGGSIILPDAPGQSASIDEEILQDCEQYSVKP
jgi:hypothetical protein